MHLPPKQDAERLLTSGERRKPAGMKRRDEERLKNIHICTHTERPDDSSRGHGGFQHQKREQIGVLSESVRSRYSCSGLDRVFTTLHKTDDVKPHLQLHENQRGKQTQ
ncbi:hypothetical protein DPX16_1442 [Anabarilius grahami]|uniref:Uncharacterized protein n=1 Tax=Anabarilius grahami TaxID=495550 RepID=A0A3N0YKL8_ANAGA|nr:hypothetical protein DPX16_1442 [Anabarilius grahami]